MKQHLHALHADISGFCSVASLCPEPGALSHVETQANTQL